ncbi:hypothetical protein TEA_003351 [Camellia sinensis var. sinensis]|uniref:SNARE-interacting protein KEULE n=1 Tax=Camellia sinensis var. sinensis TaxID=542762 RepID=A0A4S4DC40_CAMSN|nr:hypothetical protein TEA_003351 [Camellia sinensis var. sinensis]
MEDPRSTHPASIEYPPRTQPYLVYPPHTLGIPGMRAAVPGFITDNVMALEDLFGDEESTRKGDACLNMMATRIATAFASLREFPLVRYHAAKSLDPTTMTTFRDLIPTKLAAGVWNCLMKYKADLPNFPQTETCELLIVDRSVDQIAPVIHEWTYDAMCHDLLNMDGNKYVHEIPGKAGGVPEKKEVLLEDHDPIWLELRHAHIADASERLHEKMISFVSRNKAAQIHHGSRDGGEISTRDLQKMVQALPQYSEQIDKLSLHVDIAGKINNIVKEMGLKELGQLEQDLVFGDAGTKDVINFLRTNQDVTRENKLRLLMIYAACYPEKFEDDKITKLMELARLPPEDMNAVNNMRLLEGSSDTKKSSTGAFSLKFDVHKNKHAARKDRTGEQVMWQLSRFYPMVEELIEKLSKGELPKDDYPCMNDPSPTFHGTSRTASVQTNQAPAPHSMRQRRATWARPRDSEDGYSSDSILRHASSDFKKMGQRIFVFIVGGATRSELRVCHKLTAKLNREVVLGSSSLDDPPQFITKLKLLTAHELSMDDDLYIKQFQTPPATIIITITHCHCCEPPPTFANPSPFPSFHHYPLLFPSPFLSPLSVSTFSPTPSISLLSPHPSFLDLGFQGGEATTRILKVMGEWQGGCCKSERRVGEAAVGVLESGMSGGEAGS